MSSKTDPLATVRALTGTRDTTMERPRVATYVEQKACAASKPLRLRPQDRVDAELGIVSEDVAHECDVTISDVIAMDMFVFRFG